MDERYADQREGGGRRGNLSHQCLETSKEIKKNFLEKKLKQKSVSNKMQREQKEKIKQR